MADSRDIEYMTRLMTMHVAWGRERIAFWKHIVMIEATVLGLGAGLSAQQTAAASLLISLAWWALALAICLGSMLIWAQLERWHEHETVNQWAIEMEARIQRERMDGSSEAARLLDEYRNNQLQICTAKLFPDITASGTVPKSLPAPTGAPSLSVRASRPGVREWILHTSPGARLLARCFATLSLVAMVLLLIGVSWTTR